MMTHRRSSKDDTRWQLSLQTIRKLMGGRKRKLSEADVVKMLEEGKRSGAIDSTEHDLMQSILEFTDTTVKEIMVPRTDVIAVEVSTSRDQLIRIVIDEGYSRIPVYQGTLDHVIGILYTKDLLSMFEHQDIIILQDILRPPFLVPESKNISRLLKELQIKKQHMAIVIDEFGGMEGIVTMEDILEEIVGEIGDEYDEDRKDVETTSDGSVVVSGGIDIGEFNKRFAAQIPEGKDYETLSGFLHKLTGKIPELHEEIVHGHLLFTVIKKNQRRIQQVRVRSKIPSSPGAMHRPHA